MEREKREEKLKWGQNIVNFIFPLCLPELWSSDTMMNCPDQIFINSSCFMNSRGPVIQIHSIRELIRGLFNVMVLEHNYEVYLFMRFLRMQKLKTHDAPSVWLSACMFSLTVESS